MRRLVAAGLSVIALSCAARHEWGGEGTTAPMHPDSLEAMPLVPAPEPRPVTAVTAAPSVDPAVQPPAGTPPIEGVPPFTAAPAKYTVEPGGKYSSLAAVAPLLKPGDIVDVMGDATYLGGVRFDQPGKPLAKIVIRGVPRNGKLPILSGGDDTIEAAGDHYVFEGLDITGGAKRCFFHHADDITVRLSRIHDCKEQGLLGADTDSGSLLLEHSEIYRSGNGVYSHQIYMATDEKAHKGSVFRMQFCWVHDGNGGNNVKSRAERNEILYNWIEGALYHEVELIGPDGQDPKLAREDSQVIGNVLIKNNNFFAVRIGGDGTGATSGRYRFVSNTFVMAGDKAAIRAFDALESVELFENVFLRKDGKAVTLLSQIEADWVAGNPVITGARNWLPTGSTIPRGLVDTKTGATPGFVGSTERSYRPAASGAIATVPAGSTATDPSRPVAGAIAAAQFEPPMAKLGPPRARRAPRASLGAFDP